jgi:ubiquinol-cytochrome c reductase iron-sulfur subunit
VAKGDEHQVPEAHGEVDEDKRQFLAATTGVIGALGCGAVAVPLIRSLEPDASVAAAATTIADLSDIGPGMQKTVSWQDKPVIIVHRTPEMLATLSALTGRLADPDSHVPQQPPYAQNIYRSRKPEWLVMVRVCTHLCCIPLFEPTPGSVEPAWRGGFHCPCHGSSYDLAGRVFKDVPAPRNMAIPEYEFINGDSQVRIMAMYPKARLC